MRSVARARDAAWSTYVVMPACCERAVRSPGKSSELAGVVDGRMYVVVVGMGSHAHAHFSTGPRRRACLCTERHTCQQLSYGVAAGMVDGRIRHSGESARLR